MKNALKMLIILGCFLAFGLTQVDIALAGAIRPGFNSQNLPENDDDSTGLIDIGFPVNFFGNSFTKLYVNNNGNVTFDYPEYVYTPYSFENTNRKIIAPFFADIDTRGFWSDIVRYGFGSGQVEGRPAFGVNWVNVGYYNGHSDKLNSIQLVIIDRSDVGSGVCEFEFNYDSINWETGDYSGGNNGLGGNSARVGFSTGTVSYEMVGSGINGAFLDSSIVSGLIHRSLANQVPGRFRFLCFYENDAGNLNYYADVPLKIRCRDGCPVDLVTGEEEHSPGQDISITSPSGVKADFTRSYHTARAKTGTYSPGLTEGWVHNYDSTIISQTSFKWGPLYYLTPEGKPDTFQPTLNGDGNPTGAFSVRAGAPFRATGVAGASSGEWDSIAITYKNGTTKQFTSFSTGMLVLSTITDNLGRTLELHWDSNRRLESVEDTTSQTTLLTFTYDINGFLNDVLDNAGRKVHYTTIVPGNGIATHCLNTVSQISLSTDTTPPIHWTYEYVAFEGHPLIASFSDPNPTGQGQRTVSFTYNPANGRVATQTTANGNVHAYSYGTGQTQVAITDGQGNNLTSRTEYYDAEGRKLGEGDAFGNRSTMEYADANNPYHPTRIIERDGKTQSFTYDQYGNTLTETDQKGETTSSTYDYAHGVAGRLIRVQQGRKSPIAFKYLEPSGLVKMRTTLAPGSSKKTVSTVYTYDFEENPTIIHGRLVRIEGPGNNAASRIISTYTYNYTDDSQYDAHGNPGTFHATSNGRPLTLTDKHGRITHFRYDLRGNCTIMIDPDGRKVDHQYNLADQLTEVTLPARTPGGGRRRETMAYQYPGGLPGQVTAYDAEGNSLRQVTTTYNSTDQILSVTGGTDPVSYEYDALGRQTKIIDGNNQATNFSYDTYDRLAQITYPDLHTVQFTAFDQAGRVLRSVDGNGVESTYYYNDSGKLQSIKRPNQPDISFSYDANDRLSYSSNSEGYCNYTYDMAGHLLSQRIKYTDVPLMTLSYQYYPNGSVQKITSPAGTYSYQYDDDGRLIALTNPANHTSRWTYRPDHTIQRQQLGNHASTIYTYNNYYQIVNLTNYAVNGRVLSEYSNLLRNELDDLTGMKVTLPGLPAFSGQVNFEYDSKSQLTQDQWVPALPGGVTSVNNATYDPAGNPLSGTVELDGFADLTRAYNESNQWVGYHDAQGNLDGDTLFAYDGNGNPTIYKGNHLTFNADNQLSVFSNATDQQQMTAGYTASGLRAWKEADGQRTYYIYSGDYPLCELAQDGTVKAYNTWGPTGLINRTNVPANKEIWYQYDPLGNVTQRLDASGKVVSTDRYDAWGNRVAGGDNTDPYGYLGQRGYYTDRETNLILCTYRYYDPQFGRWLTRDPIGYIGGTNLYAYCYNNLINQFDPLGLCLACKLGLAEWAAEIQAMKNAAAIARVWQEALLLTEAAEAAAAANAAAEIVITAAEIKLLITLTTVVMIADQAVKIYIYSDQACPVKPAAELIPAPPPGIEIPPELLPYWAEFKKYQPDGTWEAFLDWLKANKGIFILNDVYKPGSVQNRYFSCFILPDKSLSGIIPEVIQEYWRQFKLDNPEGTFDDFLDWLFTAKGIYCDGKVFSLIAERITHIYSHSYFHFEVKEWTGVEWRGKPIETRAQWEELIQDIITNPTESRPLDDVRKAYWHDPTKTVVVFNPNDSDLGTAFIPDPAKWDDPYDCYLGLR